MHSPRPSLELTPDLQHLIDAALASGAFQSAQEAVKAALQASFGKPASHPADTRLNAILEGIGDAFYALDRDWRFTYINAAAEAYYGRPRQEMLGRIIWDAFPWATGAELRARYEQAMETRQTVVFETPSVRFPDRHYEVSLFPYDGGLGVRFTDRTERKRSEETLRASEARFRLAVEAAQLAIFELDARNGTFSASPELNELLGITLESPVPAETIRSLYHPDDREWVLKAREMAEQRRERYFQVEFRFRYADGSWRWCLLRAENLFDENGSPTKLLGVVLDITERKQIEEALRRNEETLRLILDEMPVGVTLTRILDGTLIFQNAKAAELLGSSVEGLSANQVGVAVHEDGRPYRPEEYPTVRTIEHGENIDHEEMLYRRSDGRLINLDVSSAPILNEMEGEAFAVSTFYDITERKRAEERQKLLINELNHRVKNTLATVQSIATQSLKNIDGLAADGSSKSALAAFESRLIALARGHDVLTRENWESARLQEIVDGAIAPYLAQSEDAHRFQVQGPDLRLMPTMALSLSMILHELCTNAVKYGALVRAAGTVHITWDKSPSPEGPHLTLCWRELGGPPVTPPQRTGFGTRLIERSVTRELGGTVRMAHEAAGLVCTIEVPLPLIAGEPV